MAQDYKTEVDTTPTSSFMTGTMESSELEQIEDFIGRQHADVFDASLGRHYGGEFPWVGAPYKMKIASGISPLQWLNGLTKRLLVLDDIVFDQDGGFHRPGHSQPLFPRGDVNLRWRWDSAAEQIVIDFFNKGRLLDWRWDELRPEKELRFPSTVSDWVGLGHVGRFTFRYSLRSAIAEEASSPSRSSSLFGTSLRGTRCETSVCDSSADAWASIASYDASSFYSCFGEELEAVVAGSSFRAGDRRSRAVQVKRARRNDNRVSQYYWLQEILTEVSLGLSTNKVHDMDSGEIGTPLFVIAGSCPNAFCGMQAVLCSQLPVCIDFWWIKPKADMPQQLDGNSCNKHSSGSMKNTAERSKKLYMTITDRFYGSTEGQFRFGVDSSSRAFIEESRGDGESEIMYVYLIWQESWSSALSRSKFMEGKICYTKVAVHPAGSSSQVDMPPLFSRQYRLADGHITIAPAEDEEMVSAVLPPDTFQEMYDMKF